MSTQIFLYITGGRTLWVPSHAASASETRPIHILNFVTPSELSRSFYLFDFPVMLVDHARHAAGNPHARVPQDVLAAVNEFRRVCAEDQNFLLERCYNPHKPASSNAGASGAAGNMNSNTSSNNSNTNNNNSNSSNKPSILDNNMYNAVPAQQSSASPSIVVGSNNTPSPAILAAGAGAPGMGNNNIADVLTQLLQQQQQQTAPSSSSIPSMMPNNLYANNTVANMYGNAPHVPAGMSASLVNPVGAAAVAGNTNNTMPLMNMLGNMPAYPDGAAGRFISPNMAGGGGGGGVAGMSAMHAMTNFVAPGGILAGAQMPMMMPNNPYMRGGHGGHMNYNGNNSDGGQGMRMPAMYGNSGALNNRRRMTGGYNNNNNNNPRLPHYAMQQPHRGGMRNNNFQSAHEMGGNMSNNHNSVPDGMSTSAAMGPGPFNGAVRREPEPIEINVAIPPEVLATYTNPSQQLVCATMPGPRMTVWLREHEPPKDTTDRKYVFCRGGIILMLKAKGEEVLASKPVELFGKQICTHFLIHGVCSRSFCLHEHHSEEQLRQLIAARHVELKAMTKKQRHELIHQIMEKEKEGLAHAEAERVERQKQHSEALAARQAGHRARPGGAAELGNSSAGGTTSASTDSGRNETAAVGSANSSAANMANMELSSEDEYNNHDGSTSASGRKDKSSRRQNALSHSQRTAGSDDALPSSSAARGGSRATTFESRDGEESEQRVGVGETPKSQSTKTASRLPMSRLDNIGVTDSEDDDDDASSTSSSSSSSASSRSRHSDLASKKKKRRVMKRSDSAASSSSSSSSDASVQHTEKSRKRRAAAEMAPRGRPKKNRSDATAPVEESQTRQTNNEEEGCTNDAGSHVDNEEEKIRDGDGLTQMVRDRVEELLDVGSNDDTTATAAAQEDSHSAHVRCRSVDEDERQQQRAEEEEKEHQQQAEIQQHRVESRDDESIAATHEEGKSTSANDSTHAVVDGVSFSAESTPVESSDLTQSTEDKSGEAEESRASASGSGGGKKVAVKKRGRPSGAGAGKKPAGTSKK